MQRIEQEMDLTGWCAIMNMDELILYELDIGNPRQAHKYVFTESELYQHTTIPVEFILNEIQNIYLDGDLIIDFPIICPPKHARIETIMNYFKKQMYVSKKFQLRYTESHGFYTYA